MLTLFHQGPGGFTGPRRDEKSRPLTVLQVDASLCDLIQDPGGGAHRHTAFHPEDRAGGQSAVWSTRRATAFHLDGAQTSSFLMTHVCVCASHVHTHMNLRGDSMYRSTHTQTRMLHTPALRQRKTRTKSGYVRTCAHTHNMHTCLHLGAFSRSSSTPAGLKAIHVDTHTSTRSAKTSAYLLHTRPAAPTPRCMQLIRVHIHTAVYSCAPTATLCTPTRLNYTHVCTN